MGTLAAAAQAADLAPPLDGWEKYDQIGPITMYQREFPATSVLAFRAQGLLDARMDLLLSVVRDTSRKLEWMDRIKEARIVQVVEPDPSRHVRVEFNHIGLPWPLQDREFVFRTQVEVVEAERAVKVRISDEGTSEIGTAPGRVRGELLGGFFIFKPIEGGQKTWVDVMAHADPKGGIPKLFVNLVARSWPHKTLKALQSQLTKPDIVPHPVAAKLMRGLAAGELSGLGAPPSAAAHR